MSGEVSAQRLRPAQARVDLDRLGDNYRAIAAFAGRPVMPVVKADAYGHGAIVVAKHLERLGAPLLAVAYPEEGAALRRGGVAVPIVVLAGFTGDQWPVLQEFQLTPTVATPQTAHIVEHHADGARPITIHLKVDTGMTRLGLTLEEVTATARRLHDRGVEIEGFMTHLASADEDPEFTRTQLDRFDAAIDGLARVGIRPRRVHAANSAGLAFLRSGHTLVRPGLMLYGVKPRPLAPEIDVRPVMTVSTRVSAIKDVPKGTPVSYGGRWVASCPSRIATLPMGYADGVPRTRAMAERGEWMIRGRRVPVAGTVCMDLTMLDVTEHPDVSEGDEAVLFGDEPTAWEVAEHAGTNAWAVLTAVGPRVPRVHVEGGRTVAIESHYADGVQQ